ncbi:MAG: hypothetical protein K9N23_22625, partial [Akkermansiaceae bacterium]|nr:hypothetical protein [Akkermansiaceae bacterium]
MNDCQSKMGCVGRRFCGELEKLNQLAFQNAEIFWDIQRSWIHEPSGRTGWGQPQACYQTKSGDHCKKSRPIFARRLGRLRSAGFSRRVLAAHGFSAFQIPPFDAP